MPEVDTPEHPDAMFPIPGMDDLKQLADARDEMAVTGHPPVILIMGENDLMHHVLLFEGARGKP